MNALAGATHFGARVVPAGDPREDFGCFGVKVGEALAEELADDQRVEHRGKIFRCRDDGAPARVSMQPVHLPGEIGFVSAGSVVARAAWTDSQTERHRLQAARIVSRHLETLDVHGPIRRGAAGFDRRTSRAFGQQRTDALALGNRVNSGNDSLGVAEAQSKRPRLRQQPLRDSLGRPGQRAAGADRVESVVVAETGRLQNAVRIADTAERSQRKQRLVLEPLLFAGLRFEEPLAANRARGAAVAAAERRFGQRLSAERIGILKGGLLEIASGQRAKPVEHSQVRDGS